MSEPQRMTLAEATAKYPSKQAILGGGRAKRPERLAIEALPPNEAISWEPCPYTHTKKNCGVASAMQIIRKTTPDLIYWHSGPNRETLVVARNGVQP